MMELLQPYAEMKPSGSPWLGNLPAHWDMLPLSRLSRQKSVVKVSDRQLLSVYLYRGVVKFSDVDEKRTNATSEDLSKYQAVEPGDFVLNNQQAWRGSVGVSRYCGIVSPAYLVLSLSGRLLRDYANYLLRDRSMVSQYLICSKGVGTIQRNLYWPHLKSVLVAVPPLDEQRLIVRFLDWHGSQTAKLIRAKKKIIALLNEQKQAIIHRAVTRGLDPNVRLKPSGIPWLGDVPEGWEIVPALACYRERNTKNIGMAESTVLSLSYGRIIIKPPEKLRGLVPESFETYQIVEPGNIIVRSTDLQNDQKSLRVGIARDRGIITSAYMCLRTIGAMNPEFGYQVLNTYDLLKIIYGYGSGLRQNLGFADIRRMPVPLPPQEQQVEIVNFLGQATAAATRAIEHMGNEIALIQEFRTRLIADVVTGKLDVRAIAATLPDMVEKEPIEDASEEDDLDGEDADPETEEAAA